MTVDAFAFAAYLFSNRGIELYVKRNTLKYWPGSRYKRLSESDFVFIAENREALKQLVRDGRQPRFPADYNVKAADRSASTATATPCPGCRQVPCVGKSHPHYNVLHDVEPPPERDRHSVMVEREFLRRALNDLGHHVSPRPPMRGLDD